MLADAEHVGFTEIHEIKLFTCHVSFYDSKSYCSCFRLVRITKKYSMIKR